MKNHLTSSTAFRIKQLVGLLTTFCLVLILTGCPAQQKEAAKGLVKTGTGHMEELASFYETLARDRADYEELFVLLRVIPTGTVETPTTKRLFEEQITALQVRATHARAIKALYVSLGKLVDYDASGEVQTAVKNLLDAAKKVKTFKLSIPVPGFTVDEATVTAALNKGIELLTTYLQVRAFRKHSPEAAAYLSYIRTVYDAESFLYLQIIRDYDDFARVLDKKLIQNDQLSASSRFQRHAERYNLQLNGAASSDQSVKDWAKDRIDADYEAGETVARDLVARQVKNLTDLQREHQDFMAGRTKKAKEPS